MELIALIVGALLGWQHASFGQREWQVMGLVVAGWTAVTTAASVPYLSIESFVVQLVWHTAVVVVPYTVAALAKRIVSRRR